MLGKTLTVSAAATGNVKLIYGLFSLSADVGEISQRKNICRHRITFPIQIADL